MKRFLTLLLFSAGLTFAQSAYVAYNEAVLAGTASVVTVQQPASNSARIVRFVAASLYCSAACDVTLERNGTAATTTALTPTPINTTTSAAKAKAFSASNVGAGTVLSKYSLVAGGTMVIDLAVMNLSGTGTTKNLTFRTSAITGTARITVQFNEEY